MIEMIGFILAFLGLGVCCLLATIKILRTERKKSKQPAKQQKFIGRIPTIRVGISRLEIEARIRNAKRKRRNIKISPKHFPNSPAFEKRIWDRTKDPEEKKDD